MSEDFEIDEFLDRAYKNEAQRDQLVETLYEFAQANSCDRLAMTRAESTAEVAQHRLAQSEQDKEWAVRRSEHLWEKNVALSEVLCLISGDAHRTDLNLTKKVAEIQEHLREFDERRFGKTIEGARADEEAK